MSTPTQEYLTKIRKAAVEFDESTQLKHIVWAIAACNGGKCFAIGDLTFSVISEFMKEDERSVRHKNGEVLYLHRGVGVNPCITFRYGPWVEVCMTKYEEIKKAREESQVKNFTPCEY
jgi:hypothetical protein